MITVNRVSKTFHLPSVRRDTLREHVLGLFRPRRFERLTVLDNVSFEVHAGETLGILGRNGSGKSTLLKIVAGIYRPDGGSIELRAPITSILELGLGWNPDLDAIDNIWVIGSVLGMSLREIRTGLDDILAFAELERFAHLKLRHFSSGMALRLAYAIAFKAVREILILDEIFAVGDERFQARCKDRYRELKKAGHTVLLVSHSPAIVQEFCDRALLLEGGHIQADDAPRLVFEAYRDISAIAPAIEPGHHSAST